MVIVGFNVKTKQDLRVEKNILEQNLKAMNDSLRISKTKNNQIIASKNVLIAKKEKDIALLDKNLNDQIKNLKGDIYQLTSTNIRLKGKIDSLENGTDIDDIIIQPDGSFTIPWDFSKVYDPVNNRRLTGKVDFTIDSTFTITSVNSSLLEDEINFNITQGLRERNGNIEMFATSSYPGFGVTELNSVVIDPQSNPIFKKYTKKRRVGVSIYVGYGFTYHLQTSQVFVGPQAGAGLTYKLF